MKNLLFSISILAITTIAASCKKEQNTLDSLVGEWSIDKVELLEGPKGDSIFTDNKLVLNIGACTTTDNGSAGCQTSAIKLDGKTIFKEVSIQYNGGSLFITSSNREGTPDEVSLKRADLFAGVYTIKEQSNTVLTLQSVPIGASDKGKFFFDYRGFKYSTSILRLKK